MIYRRTYIKKHFTVLLSSNIRHTYELLVNAVFINQQPQDTKVPLNLIKGMDV